MLQLITLVWLAVAFPDDTPLHLHTMEGQALEERFESRGRALEQKEAVEASIEHKRERHLKARDLDLEHLGTSKPSSWLETKSTETSLKPTSLLEADQNVQQGLADLDKALDFPDTKPSSLIELPGRARQRARFEAARQRLHMVEDSVQEDSIKLQQRATHASAALLETPSSLMETHGHSASGADMSKASQRVQDWAAMISTKQDNFIRKLAAHGMHLPASLRDVLASDAAASSMVQTRTAAQAYDDSAAPHAHITPEMVDSKFKAVERRLRRDAQIFQEEADTGRRAVIPSSFLQTTYADEFDSDSLSEEGKEKDALKNPIKATFDQMKHIRHDLVQERKHLANDDSIFQEGAKRAKADLAAWKKAHAISTSFMQTKEHVAPDLNEVDASLKQLAQKIHGETAKWRSEARHASQMSTPSEPESFLQNSEGNAVSLQAWEKRLTDETAEREASRAKLEKELSFDAADYGPELMDKLDLAGRSSSLLEEGDPVQTTELKAEEGSEAEADFQGVITPGVITPEAESPDSKSESTEAATSAEDAAKADEDAATAADTAEMEEEKAEKEDENDENAEKKAEAKLEEKEDQETKEELQDTLRKHS